MIEDRDFREFFGCSILVLLDLWEILVEKCLVPDDGCST